MSDAAASATALRVRGKFFRIWGIGLLSFVVSIVLLWFLLTSSSPLRSERAAPSPEQVGAGRDAYRQIKEARANRNGKLLLFGPAQLDGMGALASHGFRPDRLFIETRGAQLVVQASHHLPLGRWLNVELTAEGPSKQFPRTWIKIGSLELPPPLSRWALQLGRWILRMKVADVPPLDQLVRNFSVQNGSVAALVSLPGKSGLIDQMAGAIALPVNDTEVVRLYCALADRQKKQPSEDFAEQVRRVFSIDPQGADRADTNRAAFLALGMLVVDQRIADFAGPAKEQVKRCLIPPVSTVIDGRRDSPEHWALSAAIAAGAGVQLSEAVGEWKELADSLAKQSRFAVGDPSGFSLADIAADRAGFLLARAAVQPDQAERIAGNLANATAEQILPTELVQEEETLHGPDFERRYGGVDDPRFRKRLAEIDAVLSRTGLR